MRRTGRFLLGLLLGGLLIGLFGFLSNGFTLKPSEWGDKFKPAVPDEPQELPYNIEIEFSIDTERFEFSNDVFDYNNEHTILDFGYNTETLIAVHISEEKINFKVNLNETSIVETYLLLEIDEDYYSYESFESGYKYDFTDLKTKIIDEELVLDPLITEL